MRVFTRYESGVMALAITPPGVLKPCLSCKASTEVRDRTLARAVPHSGRNTLISGDGIKE